MLGGEIMDITALQTGIIVLVVIAIINRIKTEVPPMASYWYTLMAFGVGAGVYAVVTFAPAFVSTIFFIGLAASGIYDVFKKT